MPTAGNTDMKKKYRKTRKKTILREKRQDEKGKIIDFKTRQKPGKYEDTGYILEIIEGDENECPEDDFEVLEENDSRNNRRDAKNYEGIIVFQYENDLDPPERYYRSNTEMIPEDEVDIYMKSYRKLREINSRKKKRQQESMIIMILFFVFLILFSIQLTQFAFANNEFIQSIDEAKYFPEESVKGNDKDIPEISNYGPITYEILPELHSNQKTENMHIGSKGTTENFQTSLGEFEITAYDKTESLDKDGNLQRTSTGVFPRSNHTVAVDPNVIPLGSKLLIGGSTYTAEDTGGKVKGRVVDIYFDTHEETEVFGRQKKTVYVLEWGSNNTKNK
jgi:3D (Asp-Asp-Asp) domain-containing protein/predicted nucleic acid-binding Zn ribbon protein